MPKINKKIKKYLVNKSPKRKKRRKKGAFNGLFFSIVGFLVFIFLGGLGVNYLSPNQDAKEMKISGINDSSVNEEEIKSAIDKASNLTYSLLGKEIKINNLFVSEEKKLDMILEQFPQIEGIDIQGGEDGKGEMVLNIKERKPAAVWCSEGKCVLVSENSNVIGDYVEKEEYMSLPRINNESWKDEDDYRKGIVDYVCNISKYLSEIPEFKNAVYSAYPEKLVAKGSVNCEFIFNPEEDIEWQLEKMRMVIKKEDFLKDLATINYVDLRFKNQVIIK
jgi:hypothetical protein